MGSHLDTRICPGMVVHHSDENGGHYYIVVGKNELNYSNYKLVGITSSPIDENSCLPIMLNGTKSFINPFSIFEVRDLVFYRDFKEMLLEKNIGMPIDSFLEMILDLYMENLRSGLASKPWINISDVLSEYRETFDKIHPNIEVVKAKKKVIEVDEIEKNEANPSENLIDEKGVLKLLGSSKYITKYTRTELRSALSVFSSSSYREILEKASKLGVKISLQALYNKKIRLTKEAENREEATRLSIV